MVWEVILKRKGTSPRKLEFVERYGLDEDNFYTIYQVLSNLKERRGGFLAGQFNTVQLRIVLDKLVREGRAEKRPTTMKVRGGSNKQTMEYRKLSNEVSKSDWKTTVDNLVSKDTQFDKIYDSIVETMRFNSPSKKEVLKYLQDNYQRHKLWSNLWSVKDD